MTFEGQAVWSAIQDRANIKLAIAFIIVFTGFIFAVDAYYTSLPYYNSYISDEIWYVDSARNIMLKLGIQPRTSGPMATVFIDKQFDLNIIANQILSIQGVESVKKIEKAWAIYVRASSWNAFSEIEKLQGVIEIKPGYEYGDAENINNYYNMEHPPLGKYILMFSMASIGDNPAGWRIPGMISGGVLCIAVGLIVREATRRDIYAVLASVLAASDPLIRNMAGVAMLDIYLSLFTTLSIYAATRNSWILSGVFLGLAISTKMSGVFAALPLIVISIINGRSITGIYRDLILIPGAVFMVLNLPIIQLFGLQAWYDQSIVGAISWHLRTKTAPGEGPPISAPWMWLYGDNPFYLTVSPDTVARGNIYVYLGSIALSAALLPAARFFQCMSMLTVSTYMTWLGYVILWILGNHSQYSFYMVQLSPLFSALFMTQLWAVFENIDIIIPSYSFFYRRRKTAD
jgi:predicted membrane-bound dolichyl-phosphate-mannose-protein mannosyltransferase